MNTPQFSKGQTLTAESMNQLAQNQRELADRVGRAGLASRYAGPQQLKPVPLSTAAPTYLDPLAAPSSVAGVYVRKPWIEDVFATQRSDSLALAEVTRTDGSPLQAGDEIFQRITVSDSGAYQSAGLEVFPATSAPPPSDLWEPGSGSSVMLYRRIGSVIPDPRYATTDAWGEPLPFHPLVVSHHDTAIPILPRNAAVLGSSVGLVAPLSGSTIPIKKLVAGSGVLLADAGSSVEISANGAGGALAESSNSLSGSVLNISTVPGVIDGIQFDPSAIDSSILPLINLPTITNGRINLPPHLFGFVVDGSSVTMPNLYTSGAQRTVLATLTIGTETRELCAHFDRGFLQLSFV